MSNQIVIKKKKKRTDIDLVNKWERAGMGRKRFRKGQLYQGGNTTLLLS